MSSAVSVVISAAGMGTRLGLNVPKALVEIGGKPLIAHQMDLLDEVADVVVVAGYQAEAVMDLVSGIRPDVVFALNHQFASTGTAASLRRGALVANPTVVALDGDLLVARADFYAFLERGPACLGLTAPASQKPVYADVDAGEVVMLSQTRPAAHEWTGLTVMPRETAVGLGDGHVFHGLNAALPMPYAMIDSIEIDEPADLQRARRWLAGQGGSLRG